MLVFAYGSNMNLNRLLQRVVPSAVKVSNAFLPGFKLICKKVSKDSSAKANIVKTNISGELVWGVLFNIDSKEKHLLDKAEGLGMGYNEDTLTFFDETNNSYAAQIYNADSNSIDNTLLPYDWHKEFIVTGGIQNKLPADYISQLQSIPCVPDPDEKRRLENYSIRHVVLFCYQLSNLYSSSVATLRSSFCSSIIKDPVQYTRLISFSPPANKP